MGKVVWDVRVLDQEDYRREPRHIRSVYAFKTDSFETEETEIQLRTADGNREFVARCLLPHITLNHNGIGVLGYAEYPTTGRTKHGGHEDWMLTPAGSRTESHVEWHAEFKPADSDTTIDVIDPSTLQEDWAVQAPDGDIEWEQAVRIADKTYNFDSEWMLLVEGQHSKRWVREAAIRKLNSVEFSITGDMKHRGKWIAAVVALAPSGVGDAARLLGTTVGAAGHRGSRFTLQR